MTDFSPREIVSELDRFIVGQTDAKRAVSIALRNRWRRLQLDDKLREEVLPKNILMIGPTGVGSVMGPAAFCPTAPAISKSSGVISLQRHASRTISRAGPSGVCTGPCFSNPAFS